MCASEVERDFHEAMNLCIFFYVVLEPSRQDVRWICALVLQRAHILKGAGDGALDGRPEEIRLAVKIVVDESRVDAERAGDVLNGHGREVPLGKEIKRRSEKFVYTGGAVLFTARASRNSAAYLPLTAL